MEFITALDQKLHRVLFFLLYVIGTAMTAIVFLGVLFRYVIKAPLPWAEEMSRYLMVWGACIGAAVAYREGGHVAVTVALERLPKNAARTMILCGRLSVALFAVFVGIWGLILIARFRGQTSPAMGIPMAIPYLSVPLGCLLILYESIVLIIGFDKRRDGMGGPAE